MENALWGQTKFQFTPNADQPVNAETKKKYRYEKNFDRGEYGWKIESMFI